MKKTLGLVGLAAVTLGSSFSAMPALASTADCGPTPTGGTLTETNGFCTLKFTNAGSYTFTTSSTFSELAAVSIGGGGGFLQYGDNSGWATGYAGNAGSVEYADLTQVTKGSAFQITVGAGGASAMNAGAPGTATTITGNSQTISGAGAVATTNTFFCIIGTNGNVGVGDGAGGISASHAGETCAQAPGYNFTSNIPTLFPTNDVVIGLGGMLYNAGSRPVLKPGSGANGLMTSTEPSTWVSYDQKGADGAAIFRWKLSELANTGSNADQTITWSVGSLVLGAVLLSASRLRRRQAPARHRAS